MLAAGAFEQQRQRLFVEREPLLLVVRGELPAVGNVPRGRRLGLAGLLALLLSFIPHATAIVGRWLGFGVGDLINLFNPELVVLGGLYHRLFGFLEPSVLEGARLRALDAPGEMATIAASGLGIDAPLLGAAELVLSGVMADPAGARTRSVSP